MTTLTGEATFRLMPSDAFDSGPSTAAFHPLGAEAFNLTYTWRHAVDGDQTGSLVVGAVGEDGVIEAAWFDTWHQKPGLMLFKGTRTDGGVALRGTYLEEWGWEIDITLPTDAGASMVMRNVVPESALAMLPPDSPAMAAGPYDVSVATWR